MLGDTDDSDGEDYVVPPGSPEKLLQETVQHFGPKKEELEYKFTDEELKMLCTSHKIKVDMTFANPLHRYYRHWKKRGSFERHPGHELELLMKAYNRYKNHPAHHYTDQQMAEIKKDDWEYRKACMVRYIKKQKEAAAKKASGASGNSESVENVALDSTQSGDNLIVAETIEIESENTENLQNVANNSTASIDIPKSEIPKVKKPRLSIPVDTQSSEDCLMISTIAEKTIEISESEPFAGRLQHLDFLGMGLPHANVSSQLTEESSIETPKNSEEAIALEAEHASEEFNTDSLRQSLLLPNSQSLSSNQNSENYQSFHTNIPITSTQSQSQDYQSSNSQEKNLRK